MTRSLERDLGYKAKTLREISLFKRLAVEEKSRLEAMVKTIDKNDPEGADTKALNDVHESIDLEARREFSIYARFARSNGYTLQSPILENQVLPAIGRKIQDLRTRRLIAKRSSRQSPPSRRIGPGRNEPAPSA